MDRWVEEIEGWETRPVDAGLDGLRSLAAVDFSGAVAAGDSWLFLVNGRGVGVFEYASEAAAVAPTVSRGDLDAFEGAALTAYVAPHHSIPLLIAMQAGETTPRARYYTEDTPIPEVHETLTEGGFTGYLELSENVLSGDYYVVYQGGRSAEVAFIGNSRRVETDEDAFDRACDEVGIYEVVAASLEPVDLPEPDSEPSPGTTAAAGTGGDGDGIGSDLEGRAGAASGAAADASADAADRAGDAGGAAGGIDADAADAADRTAPSSEEGTRDPSGAAASGGSGTSGRPETSDLSGLSDLSSLSGPSGGDREPGERRPSDAPDGADAAGTADAAAGGPDAPGRDDATGGTDGDTDADADADGTPVDDATGTGGSRGVDAASSDDGAGGTDAPAAIDGPDVETSGASDVDERDGAGAATPADRDDLVPAITAIDASPDTATGADGDGGAPADGAGDAGPDAGPGAAGSTAAADDAGRVADLRERLAEREADLDALRRERDELAERVSALEATVRELRAGEREAAGASAGGEALSVGDALAGTNLFIRYRSKGAATLSDAVGGEATREELAENVRIEHHTGFEEAGATVAGEPFGEWLAGTHQFRFLQWLVGSLPFEIRETGSTEALRDLYTALPEIDRIELDGTVAAGPDADVAFDLVALDQMGDPLLVAEIDPGREPIEETGVADLVRSATSVAESHPDLAGAFHVTEAFFRPRAMETAREATSASLLSRDSRRSFVKISRNRGYHLCLVEARDDSYYLSVPDL